MSCLVLPVTKLSKPVSQSFTVLAIYNITCTRLERCDVYSPFLVSVSVSYRHGVRAPIPQSSGVLIEDNTPPSES